MTEKKFYKIMNSLTSEKMNEKTMYLLTEFYEDEEPAFALWGWSKNIQKFKDYVLYVSVMKTIVDKNANCQGVIGGDLIDKILDDKKLSPEYIAGLNDEEKIFYGLFLYLKEATETEDIIDGIYTLIKTINTYNYKVNVSFYPNAESALDKALELDQYLPDGEVGFGSFLQECLKD